MRINETCSAVHSAKIPARIAVSTNSELEELDKDVYINSESYIILKSQQKVIRILQNHMFKSWIHYTWIDDKVEAMITEFNINNKYGGPGDCAEQKVTKCHVL